MKKIILTAAAVFAFSFANAQDLKSSKGEAYLPQAGDWAISFDPDGLFEYAGNAFNGTDGNDAPWVDSPSYGFVGKKFLTDDKALRVSANLTLNARNYNDQSNKDTKYSNSRMDLQLGLGKEWRRGNTRLQGFYGADALLRVSSNKNSTTFEGVESTYKSGLGFGIGAQGFLGAEYFLFPKISIGAQYTYGLNINYHGDASDTNQPNIGGRSNNIGFDGVGVSNINMTLHF